MISKTDMANYDIQSSKYILGLRLFILFFGWLAFIIDEALGGIMVNEFFTIQSNLFVLVWLSLAVLWRNDIEKMAKISGSIRGAVTLYITITFVVYGIVLAPLSHPTGIDVFTNLIHHYIVPVLFIIDFLITERKQYNWKFIVPWLVYPHLYLVFSIIIEAVTGTPIYFFLDYTLGVGYLKWYLILISLFVIFSCIYIAYNKYVKDKIFTTS